MGDTQVPIAGPTPPPYSCPFAGPPPPPYSCPFADSLHRCCPPSDPLSEGLRVGVGRLPLKNCIEQLSLGTIEDMQDMRDLESIYPNVGEVGGK